MNQETAESMLTKTVCIVEATDNERFELWKMWANNSDSRCQWRPKPKDRLTWKNEDGWGVQVGTLDKRPIVVSMLWCKIDNQWVMFWCPISQVVDHKQIKAWFKDRYNGHATNSSNFHHCVNEIEKANGKG